MTVKTVEAEPEEMEINEDKIDRLIHLLHEADPSDAQQDTQEMLTLEGLSSLFFHLASFSLILTYFFFIML